MLADELGVGITDREFSAFAAFIDEAMVSYDVVDDVVDDLADNSPPVRYPRTPGYRPQGEENRYNA